MATIKIEGDITAKTLSDFRRQLDAAKGEDLTIELDSRGGAFGAALHIHAALTEWPARTTALVHHAGSAATVIMLGCNEVVMASPQSEVYIHMPTAQAIRDVSLDVADLKGAARHLEASAALIAAIYAQKTGYRPSWWLNRMAKGTTYKGKNPFSDRVKGDAAIPSNGLEQVIRTTIREGVGAWASQRRPRSPQPSWCRQVGIPFQW